MLGPTPSLLREKLGIMNFLLVHVTLQEVECGNNVSWHYLLFQCRSFTIFLMCSCHSASFWVSFRENCSNVSV